MDQSQCLQSPSHFTYLGVCYVGSNATITLSNPQDPQSPNFTMTQSAVGVPEPGILMLAVLGALFLALRRRII